MTDNRSSPVTSDAPNWLEDAFYSGSMPIKNIALRRAYDEIVKLRETTKSAPVSTAAHNHGEGDPSVMPDYAGADTRASQPAAPTELEPLPTDKYAVDDPWSRPSPSSAGSEQPVAWRITDGEGGYNIFEEEPTPEDIDWAARYGRKYEPLYTHSPDAAQAVPVPALVEFFKWAMREGPWDGGDLDGGSIQDKAESLGLIVKTQYDADKHGVQSDFEHGDDWFELAPSLKLPSTDSETT